MKMNAEPVQWSEEKQKHLQEQLIEGWSEDTWELAGLKGTKWYLRFSLTSPSLKTELKYALWYKFASGEWDMKKRQDVISACFPVLVTWLNQAAPALPSLLGKPLEYWEWSLRCYLIETSQLKQPRQKYLRANQEYVEYVGEDPHISLLRQCYKTIADAYDDRKETEKDCWDMRKMGLALVPTRSDFYLNFTSISQPWLKHLTKQFMQYNLAVHSPGACCQKLAMINSFSQFLTQHAPHCCISDIDRALIVRYISFLQQRQLSVSSRNQILVQLRMFLESCAHRLQVPGLTKEQLIFDDDLAHEPEARSREIPEEVLEQLRDHLNTLPTPILRMVVILLECGMRINELCSLPLDCLIRDDRHDWYLRFYQSKSHREQVIPLVDEKVIGTIQAQQEEIRAQWGQTCPYLFPSPRSHLRPYQQMTFSIALNAWAVKQEIKDRTGKLYHFTAHQFRHTVGMRLINENVPLEVISRLLGHRSLRMTQVYARVRDAELRRELERVARKRKTVNYQGQTVKGDPQANDPDAQLVRKGIRGQTLPVGGCGRLIVRGTCDHANKCLTCPMWLTSTDDLPALKSFYARAVRLKQRAVQVGNQLVIEQQEHIIPLLAVRIKSLEEPEMDGTLCVDDLLIQLRAELAEAESGVEEAREAGLFIAAKTLEWTITELKARIEALEGAQ
jgi:integrase/recombinase XerD